MSVLPGFNRADQLGRAVGWTLEFPGLAPRPLTLSHATHYARIEATLPGDLSGGAFRFEIEALNIADYTALAMARQPTGDDAERPLLEARLTLFWRDKVGDAPNAERAPVTAVIAVTGLARVVDGLRLKTVIEGRDRLHERLARARLSTHHRPAGPIAMLRTALMDAGLSPDEFMLHPDTDAAASEAHELEAGTPILEILTQAGERLAEATGHRGRSLFLLREGVLHAGADRPIPVADAAAAPVPIPGARGPVWRLGPEEGLIRAENLGERRLTAAELRREAETGARVLARDAYQLTVAGRPDLKPGDVVEISVEGAEASEFGGFGLPPMPDGRGGIASRQVYVNSVQHRLGKNQGWITTASGVTVDASSQPEGVWDVVHTAEANGGDGPTGDRDSADPAETVAARIRDEARAAMRVRERPRVGEVRANHQATEMAGEAVGAAAQSLDVLVGLAAPDGQPRRARRQDIRREGEARANLPYLTPFAWGPFGLVLPHYPGERVLVNHHEDSIDDPMVIGAFWQTADAAATAAPQNVQPGDWWLILPAGVDAGARAAAAGTDPAPPPDGAKASHDLTDAEGARVMQVAELTIRALDDGLTGPAERPEGGAEGGVLITHGNGARIHIDADGGITIEAAGALTLKAADDVLIEGANIQLKGGSVDVIS